MNTRLNQSNQGLLSVGVVVFLVFVSLKLLNVIDWSWWTITSPLWIPIALVVVISALVHLIVIFLYSRGFRRPPKE